MEGCSFENERRDLFEFCKLGYVVRKRVMVSEGE